MKIDSVGFDTTVSSTANLKTTSGSPRPQTGDVTLDPNPDRFSSSEASSSLTATNNQMTPSVDGALATPSTGDNAKLLRLKEQIANGTYSVPSEVLADKIIRASQDSGTDVLTHLSNNGLVH